MGCDCVCIRSSRMVKELGLDIFFLGDLYYSKDDRWTTVGIIREERMQLEAFMIIPKEVYEVVGERLKLTKLFEMKDCSVNDVEDMHLKTYYGFNSLYKLIGKPLYLTLTRP